MAKTQSGLPDVIERRGLLFGKEGEKANHADYAEQYFGAGRLMDALDFYMRCQNQAGVDKVAKAAIEEGNAFMLAQVERVTRTERDPSEWATLAANAEKAEKVTFAITAFTRAGKKDDVVRLGGVIEDDGDDAD